MKNDVKEKAFLKLHHSLIALERAYQVRKDCKAAGKVDTAFYRGNETVISKRLIEIKCLMELFDLNLEKHLNLLYDMYND